MRFELAYCLVSFAIICFLWFRLFGSLHRDQFRSNIRKIRDSLFDYVWKHDLRFDTEAYQEVRCLLNGMLATSSRLTPARFIVALFLLPTEGDGLKSKKSAFEESLDRVSDSGFRKAIADARRQAVAELVHYIFLQGIFGLALRVITSIHNRFFRATAKCASMIDDASSIVYGTVFNFPSSAVRRDGAVLQK